MAQPRKISDSAAKQRIVQVAVRVFYRNGWRSTGVEAIAKAAGITKATLYHHFESKDQLIEETLSYFSRYWRAEYVKLWDASRTKEGRLTALFDAMEQAFKQPDFYGCPFINAAAEFTEPGHFVRGIARAHYAFVGENLERFAREAELKKPRLLAEELVALITGAYAAWFAAGLKGAARQGKRMAKLVIENHRDVI